MLLNIQENADLKTIKPQRHNDSYDALSYVIAYESYLDSKIDARRLGEIRTFNENGVLLEATKFGNFIKDKWKKLIAFIKSIGQKFMESMSRILLSQKSYLEKYKNIIIGKKPKDIPFSYTGDYEIGIRRMIETECPVFNFAKYGEALKLETDGDALKHIMNQEGHSEFSNNFDDGDDNIAGQLKSYFIAEEKGIKEGNFKDLNMKDIYNFCYNFVEMENMVKKDQNKLDQSTALIESYINDKVNKNKANAANNTITSTETQNTSDTTNSTEQTTNSDKTEKDKDSSSGKNESYIDAGYDILFNEFFGKGKNKTDKPTTESSDKEPQTTTTTNDSGDNTSSDNDTTPGKTGLKIDTNAIKNMSKVGETINKQNVGDAVGELTKEDESEISKIIARWTNICRSIITAKYTACEAISSDYMDIIKSHIRSYGGSTKDEGNRKTQQNPTNYGNMGKNKEDNK